MITMYVKTNCPYAARVFAALNALNLPYEEKNIGQPDVLDELLERGGKKQSPYMVDGEVEMYESDAIVAYLEKKYGDSLGVEEKTQLRVHMTEGGACASEEEQK